MGFIDWNENLSVKVKEMDLQHQKLFEIINELHNAMSKGKGRDVLDKVLEELIKYTSYHFQNEEQYLEKYNYPEIDEHKKLHKILTEKVLDYQTKYKEGKFILSIEIMEFLKNWLTDHIIGIDKKYSNFLNQKGLF